MSESNDGRRFLAVEPSLYSKPVEVFNPPTFEELAEAASTGLSEAARKLEISDERSQAVASRLLAECRAHESSIVAHWLPLKSAAHKAHQEACRMEREGLTTVQRAIDLLRKMMRGYETQRRETERLALEQAQREAIEEAESRREIFTEALQQEGLDDEAEVERSSPLVIEPVIVPVRSQPRGLSFQKKYSATIVDPDAVPRDWCTPDMKRINELARSSKGKATLAGVEFKTELIDRQSKRLA